MIFVQALSKSSWLYSEQSMDHLDILKPDSSSQDHDTHTTALKTLLSIHEKYVFRDLYIHCDNTKVNSW